MKKYWKNFRTDMADERVDTYKRVNNLTEIEGIKVTSEQKEGFTTTIVEVLNESGSKAVDKEIGKYVTMELNEVEYLEEDTKQKIIEELSVQIKSLLRYKLQVSYDSGFGKYTHNSRRIRAKSCVICKCDKTFT